MHVRDNPPADVTVTILPPVSNGLYDPAEGEDRQRVGRLLAQKAHSKEQTDDRTDGKRQLRVPNQARHTRNYSVTDRDLTTALISTMMCKATHLSTNLGLNDDSLHAFYLGNAPFGTVLMLIFCHQLNGLLCRR